MRITFAQVRKHLKQEGKWKDTFGVCTFSPIFPTVREVLGYLNAWSKGNKTVRDYVKTEPLPPQVYDYAADFHDGPLVFVAFSLDTLGRIWGEDYPGRTGDHLVLWDGHHRTSALALRESRGIEDDHPVFVLVGA